MRTVVVSVIMGKLWFQIGVPLVLFSALARAQPPEPKKWAFKVNLLVDGSPQAVALVKSYVNRELRALGDVVVTDTDPEYQLEIFVQQREDLYALSVVTWNQIDKKTFLPTLLKAYRVEPDSPIFSLLAQAHLDVKHYLQTCTALRLDEGVKKVVAQYDVDTLQRDRDLLQKANDYSKRH
jgi:hypothetical protein